MMSRLRTKKVEQGAEARWAVCVEAYGPVIGKRISRGEFRLVNDPIVRQFPRYWSAVGPRLDEPEGVNNGSE
jgi:hypothetical protein